MNIKNIKTKHLIALALTLFMVVPMLFAAIPAVHAAGGPGVLSIVPSPSTAGATAGSTTNLPVQGSGTTLTVDVRLDDYANINIGGASNGVAGVSYEVNWNPAVLTFVSYSDGVYLPDQSNAGDFSGDAASGQLTIGQIAFDTANSQATADSATGTVTATIVFTVNSGGGSTGITLSPQPGVPYLVAPVVGDTNSQPVTGTETANALYNPLTSISLYQNPGDSSNQIQFAAGQDPIGQTFMVDIYMNNPLAVPIWGWNLGVTWNPAALQLTGATEGSYMMPTGSVGSGTANTLFLAGTPDNNAGDIPQGISDIFTSYVTTGPDAGSYTTTTSTSGVLATLTFTVVSFTSSAITLTQGIPTLETDTFTAPSTNTPSAVTPAPQLNNAMYTTNAPTAPTSPVAKITNTNSPPAIPTTSGQIITPAFTVSSPYTFALTAANSLPGMDVIPNSADTSYPSYPVTGYSWTYTASAGAPALSITSPTTTEAISFATPTTGVSGVVTYTIQLVVTTASNPNDAGYVPTSAPFTFQFQVSGSITPTTAGALLDVYVVNPGTPVYNPSTPSTTNPIYSPDGNNGNPLAYGTSAYTPNAYSDAFGPQALMTLAGYVTYNGAPVANKEVTFQVLNNANPAAVIATLTALTDENGIATVSYRLPWYDGSYTSGPQTEFGLWSVAGSVEVQSTIVTDNMPFEFGDIIGITGVTVAQNPVPRSTPTVPSTDSFTVSLSGISAQTQNYWMSYTVIDAGSVPVANGVVSGTMPAADYTVNSAGAITAYIGPSTSSVASGTITIPSYAFVGVATIEVNIYNANPVTSLSSAVPYCPQATATFTINIPVGE